MNNDMKSNSVSYKMNEQLFTWALTTIDRGKSWFHLMERFGRIFKYVTQASWLRKRWTVVPGIGTVHREPDGRLVRVPVDVAARQKEVTGSPAVWFGGVRLLQFVAVFEQAKHLVHRNNSHLAPHTYLLFPTFSFADNTNSWLVCELLHWVSLGFVRRFFFHRIGQVLDQLRGQSWVVWQDLTGSYGGYWIRKWETGRVEESFWE